MLKTTSATPKLYRTFIDLYETFEDKDKLTKAEFRLILKLFHNLLRRSMIYEGKVYQLPNFLGTLGVYKKVLKDSFKIFNYQHYKETNEKIYVSNAHSNRSYAVFKLTAPLLTFQKVNPVVQKAFFFKACRHMNRELAKAIKTENTINRYFDYELRFY